MNKKIKTKTLISVGVQKTETKDVEIVFDALRKLPEPEKSAIPVGQNFFYQIKQTKDERLNTYCESGLGEFYKKRNKFFFKREYVFWVEKDDTSYRPRNGTPPVLNDLEGHNFILFNLEDASLINCTVMEAKSLIYQFEQCGNSYYVQKEKT